MSDKVTALYSQDRFSLDFDTDTDKQDLQRSLDADGERDEDYDLVKRLRRHFTRHVTVESFP